MRWIYLSPHFDDAILSCGGLIFEQAHQGLQVEIWTIFAGNPPPGPLSEFARQNHALWGVSTGEETVAMRAAEDTQAAAILGADPVHFDFPDCIYRRQSGSGKYLYTETVIAAPQRADLHLPKRIAAALKAGLLGDEMLVCPLGLGGHVDHVLARRAAELLSHPLLYYADIPYVLNTPQTLEPAVSSLDSQLYPVSQTGLGAWLNAVSAYQSQLASLYKGTGTLNDAILSFCAQQRGARLWRARLDAKKTS